MVKIWFHDDDCFYYINSSLVPLIEGWLMIAFITWSSNLVPLLEGLCISNLCRFEFSVFWVFAGIESTTSGLTVPRSYQLSLFYIVSDQVYVAQIHMNSSFQYCITPFAFLFRKKKYVEEKRVQDLIPPLSIYTHVCTLCTCTNTHMLRFIPSGFFGPSRCLVPTPDFTSKYPTCSVCVCARASQTYIHIHSHPRQKPEKTQTATLSLPLSKTTPQRGTPSNKPCMD